MPDMHLNAARVSAPSLAVPSTQRLFLGRDAVAVPPRSADQPMRLRWLTSTGPRRAGVLRLVCALDARVAHRIAVANARTGEHFAVMPVLFAGPGQVFELALSPDQTEAALRDGLDLRLTEQLPPLWVCTTSSAHPLTPRVLQPHLFFGQGRADLETFLQRFCSVATLQPCDWMEACVLDGLRDWAHAGRSDAAAALTQHLDAFFTTDGRFVHENNRGQPADDRICGEESTGPFAVLAMERPDHAALASVEAEWTRLHAADVDGVAGSRVAAETSYSVAYPMMAMALHAGRPHLRERALRQLAMNRRHLAGHDDLWLRYDRATGERTFANWSRGVAWYALGLVRTLALLAPADRPPELVAEAQRIAAWVARHQREDGLWPCYLKESATRPDSSGSAGIAAAVALGVRHGLIDTRWRGVAERATESLFADVTPDGWLRGASQANKRETHGFDIQRDEFRVIAPWGMGLLAQQAVAIF